MYDIPFQAIDSLIPFPPNIKKNVSHMSLNIFLMHLFYYLIRKYQLSMLNYLYFLDPSFFLIFVLMFWLVFGGSLWLFNNCNLLFFLSFLIIW